jgi:16S rRNA (guanine966-N2)-methyltransferase
MRIVGGSLSGRRFAGPKGGATRPTSERVREALASALEARDAIAGATVLDLFAGTGALAFEALSRGAGRAVLVDRDRRALAAIARDAETLGLGDRVRTRPADLLAKDPERIAVLLRRDGPFTLVFIDPPYAEVARIPPVVGALVAAGALTPGALVVLERASRSPAPPMGLASVAAYRYGDTAIDVGRVPNPPGESLPP